MTSKRRKWAIKVIDTDGNEMWLRHGARPGYGAIASFTSKQTAEINAEMLSPGLDEGSSVHVVRYGEA